MKKSVIVILLLFTVNAFALPKVSRIAQLNKKNPQDAFALSLLKKKIPVKFSSYPIVLIYDHVIYRIMDRIIKENDDESKKEVVYESDYHGFSYVQTEKGINWGNLSSKYEMNTDTVDFTKARNIKKSGKYYEIGTDEIRNDSIDPDPQTVQYQNMWKKYASLKDVQKGDFIEFATARKTFKRMGPHGFGLKYNFGWSDYPTMNQSVCFERSEKVPLIFNLLDKNRTVKERITKTRSGKIRHCFIRKNSKPETLEKYSPKRIYDSPVLYVTTWKNWDDLEKWLIKKYEGTNDPDEDITNLVKSITKGLKKDDAIKEIFHWMEKNVKYVQVYLSVNSGWVPAKASEIFKRKYGDCKEKTALFIAMLKVIGVKAYPVFVSTKNKVNANLDFPMMYQFDHEITYVEDIGRFLDPVGRDMPYPYLLQMDKGRNALIFKDGKLQKSKIPWVDEKQHQRKVVKKISFEVDDAGKKQIELKYEGTFEFRGKKAQDWHSNSSYSDDEMLKHMKNEFLNSRQTLISYKIINTLDDFNKPVILNVKYKAKLDNVSYKDSKPRYIMLPEYLSLPYEDDFYKYESRKYPYIWMDEPYSASEKYVIDLPKGFKVELMPENILYDDSKGLFYYRADYTLEKNTITIMEEIKIMKAVLEPGEFSYVKAKITKLSREMKNRILLSSL